MEKPIAGICLFLLILKPPHSISDLTIHQGEIMLNKLLIQLRGHMLLDSSLKADLTVTSPNFGLDEIFSLLPRQRETVD